MMQFMILALVLVLIHTDTVTICSSLPLPLVIKKPESSDNEFLDERKGPETGIQNLIG